MTSRLLLTLLALLTGLSAQGSAVQARAMPVVTTQVAAVCALATVRGAQAGAALSRPESRLPQAPAGLGPTADNFRQPPVATPVRTGIDRARE